MKLVAGLGNPGPRYQNSRHNIGFQVVDLLAEAHDAAKWSSKFDGLVCEISLGAEKVLLLKPMTFMNLSGQSVRKAIDYLKIAIEDVLIVCDDFSLPLGVLRARAVGSSGGQKGLQNVIQHLGTENVPRLRVGIGSPGENVVGFVLSDFSASERAQVKETVIESARAVECWCRSGLGQMMNQFNKKTKTKE